jgi:hypothetical protein
VVLPVAILVAKVAKLLVAVLRIQCLAPEMPETKRQPRPARLKLDLLLRLNGHKLKLKQISRRQHLIPVSINKILR